MTIMRRRRRRRHGDISISLWSLSIRIKLMFYDRLNGRTDMLMDNSLYNEYTHVFSELFGHHCTTATTISAHDVKNTNNGGWLYTFCDQLTNPRAFLRSIAGLVSSWRLITIIDTWGAVTRAIILRSFFAFIQHKHRANNGGSSRDELSSFFLVCLYVFIEGKDY